MRKAVREWFGGLQDRICAGLETANGEGRFVEDRWAYAPDARPGEGGGITRVMTGGPLIEKGGVNLSEVTGRLSERIAERLEVEPQPFYATGVSLVIHPVSPMVPTVHMNVRYFELEETDRAWFGGGTDLTPYYLFEEDARHFHQTLKDACDPHDAAWYAKFKQTCDAYFVNTHRGEARGIGGIFFDYMKQDLDARFAFVRDVGDAFLPAYLPIVERRRNEPWGDREREWQTVRRGRYVEFNLIHDRGTLFGLETGGRTESILMSLPPMVSWVYDHHPEPGSREAALVDVLRRPRSWVD